MTASALSGDRVLKVLAACQTGDDVVADLLLDDREPWLSGLFFLVGQAAGELVKHVRGQAGSRKLEVLGEEQARRTWLISSWPDHLGVMYVRSMSTEARIGAH